MGLTVTREETSLTDHWTNLESKTLIGGEITNARKRYD